VRTSICPVPVSTATQVGVLGSIAQTTNWGKRLNDSSRLYNCYMTKLEAGMSASSPCPAPFQWMTENFSNIDTCVWTSALSNLLTWTCVYLCAHVFQREISHNRSASSAFLEDMSFQYKPEPTPLHQKIIIITNINEKSSKRCTGLVQSSQDPR
jgi:hypothetical protein